MNLIEELGLERCQAIVDGAPESIFPVKWGLGFNTYFRQVGYFVEQWHEGKWQTLYSDPTWVDLETFRAAIADYNQKNKSLDFKVGDKVVFINSIAPNDSRMFELLENCTDQSDAWSIRHATDEEIAAGYRIDHFAEATKKVELFRNSEGLEVLEMIDVSPNCGVSEL